jgi:hypothetical protein
MTTLKIGDYVKSMTTKKEGTIIHIREKDDYIYILVENGAYGPKCDQYYIDSGVPEKYLGKTIGHGRKCWIKIERPNDAVSSSTANSPDNSPDNEDWKKKQAEFLNPDRDPLRPKDAAFKWL